jgi:mRNA interferase MazF
MMKVNKFAAMLMYLFGDILIINTPFADNQGSRRRPVMVIKDTGDKNILVVKVTSQLYHTPFDRHIQDWQEAGLLCSSVVRTHKIQTIHSSSVAGQIGSLSSKDIEGTKQALVRLLTNPDHSC